MKRKDKFTNPFLHYGLLLLIYGAGGLTLLTHLVFHTFIHGESVTTYPYKYCQYTGINHTINYTDLGFRPNKLLVKRCDKISFYNASNGLIDPAFGEHENHDKYATYVEKVLGPKQTNSLIAHTTGKFLFHEHIKNQVSGILIINN